MYILTDQKLIAKMIISTLGSIINVYPVSSTPFHSKSLKLSVEIKRTKPGNPKLCLENMMPGKRIRWKAKPKVGGLT